MSQIHALRHRGRRRGAVVILVAGLLTVILGMLAIAVEGGLVMDNLRTVQGAADASALAAATQLFVHYPAIVASNFTNYDPGRAGALAALACASTNGFPSDGVKSTVTVHIPPASGPFTGKAGYAEVVLTYYQPRFFSRIWGGGAIEVVSRAVARARWGGSAEGIIVLDPDVKSALNASGTGAVTVTGGAAVIVDSNNSQAAVVTGGGGITAPNFEITGGYTGTLNGNVDTDVPPSPDPLRYLPAPAVPPDGQMTTKSLGHGNKQYTLTPGRYTNLPTFNTGDEVVLQQASVNSAGGVFYIDGGGLKSTGANITLDPDTSGGVMIYNNPASSAQSQQIQITGNSSGTVNLSALTNGPYAGLLFWQQRTATQSMSMSGGGNFTLVGTFYAANAQLQITGNGDATIGSQYISRTLNLGGNGNITINYTDNGTARIREAILVE
jgi:hypothetical protein